MIFIDNISNKIDQIIEPIAPYYVYLIFGIHLLYVMAFFGIISSNSKYLRELNIFVQTFICVFLLLRFHPFRKHTFHQSDATIIFGSAIFLLFNLGFVEYFNSFVEKKMAN